MSRLNTFSIYGLKTHATGAWVARDLRKRKDPKNSRIALANHIATHIGGRQEEKCPACIELARKVAAQNEEHTLPL